MQWAFPTWFKFNRETRCLCILPLFHNNGQITTLLAPLYAGGSTVIVKGKISLYAFWDLVNEVQGNMDKCNGLNTVNTSQLTK